MRAGKTWIDGSIENLTGVVRVYAPGVNCYECGLSHEEFNQIMLRTGCADVVRMQSSAGRVATTPISASIIGAVQVQEAMKVIHHDDEETVPFKMLTGKMWRYEGMTAGTNVFQHANWKDDCPAHVRWEPVLFCPGLSAADSVATVLERLADFLQVRAVEINMLNNKFIDRIISDNPEKAFELRMPESRLDDYIQGNDELRKLSYKTLFHKDFIENLDTSFPYPDMTLVEVGIPYYDVLHVSTEKGLFYVELSADAARYGL
jgi:adenylyltransferase/sulfurtransferase